MIDDSGEPARWGTRSESLSRSRVVTEGWRVPENEIDFRFVASEDGRSNTPTGRIPRSMPSSAWTTRRQCRLRFVSGFVQARRRCPRHR